MLKSIFIQLTAVLLLSVNTFADSDIAVKLYKKDKAFNGTTIFADNHKKNRPRIIEIDMKGNIVWEYKIPRHLSRYTNPGFDVERLPNDNVLFVLPLHGVYEIDRQGNVVWSYKNRKVTHDADRLENGNTLIAYGGRDKKRDAQVKEVDKKGNIVWSWRAKDHYDKKPYNNIQDQGWTHVNAVSRLKNGNTLISPRNFNMIVEVDKNGKVVREIGKNICHYQHDPEVLPNGNILFANHDKPHQLIEINPKTDEIVWKSEYLKKGNSPIRDADMLPNGNILITGVKRITEITKEGEKVWILSLENVTLKSKRDRPSLGFYKAQRVPID